MDLGGGKLRKAITKKQFPIRLSGNENLGDLGLNIAGRNVEG